MAQCQLKLKKRQLAIDSLETARKRLSAAKIEKSMKQRFDGIIKDSIEKIAKCITEENDGNSGVEENVTDEDHRPATATAATNMVNCHEGVHLPSHIY